MTILYPHGLGDIIMLTPALKAYYRHYSKTVDIVLSESTKGSEILDSCPYIGDISYCPNPWTATGEYEDFKRLSPVDYLEIWHENKGHKVLQNAKALGVKVRRDSKCEVFIPDDDYEQAESILDVLGLNEYTFIHNKTSSPDKDIPDKLIEIATQYDDVVWVDKTFIHTDFNINVQFALMDMAKKVFIADSVFYHAAGALGKKINLAYFRRGPNVYNRVKILQPIDENIIFEI